MASGDIDVAAEVAAEQKVIDITQKVAGKFRTFGGGNATPGNPIAEVLKSRSPMFAAGVDIEEVVRFILSESTSID